MKADLLLYNARVLSLDPARPRAEAVAIAGDRILGVGGRGEVGALAGSGTKRIDCGGGALVPGFIDAHCHVLAYLQSLLSLDLGRARSVEEAKALIAQRAVGLPPGSWVHAHGYDDFRWGRHPTRWELDEATPAHPVRLLHRTGHACVLNSLALARVGIAIDTPEPPGGLIDRDPQTGEPNGVLFEMNEYIRGKLPPLSRREMEQALSLANPTYLSAGLTSLLDASVSNDAAQHRLFCSLKGEGKLAPRLSLLMGIGAMGAGWGEGEVPVRGVKIVLDETTGRLHPPQEELNQMVLAVHRAGLPVAIHALEEAAIEAAAQAMGRALSLLPRPHRHRIEHCSVCPPPLAQKLRGLGVVVVTQPAFIYYNGEKYLSAVPSPQLPHLYPLRALRQAGLRVAGSSDSPVVPHPPLMGIYAAVSRRTEGGGVVGGEQALSSEEALALYTREAAYACGEEKEKGCIEPGKLADLCLLSADPTQVEAETLKEIKVLMTVLGGRVVWQG